MWCYPSPFRNFHLLRNDFGLPLHLLKLIKVNNGDDATDDDTCRRILLE
jgi:hypothetical protein